MKDSGFNSEFKIISENRSLPVAISLSLGRNVRNYLLEEISWKVYAEDKINVHGFDEFNCCGIDTSKNKLLLSYIWERILRGDRKPAADFILHWADSSKLIIRERHEMLSICFIVNQFCDSEKRWVKSSFRDLYYQFEEMKDNFLKCTNEINVFVNEEDIP